MVDFKRRKVLRIDYIIFIEKKGIFKVRETWKRKSTIRYSLLYHSFFKYLSSYLLRPSQKDYDGCNFEPSGDSEIYIYPNEFRKADNVTLLLLLKETRILFYRPCVFLTAHFLFEVMVIRLSY